MSNEKESFEEWFKETKVKRRGNNSVMDMRSAWNHQQKKIDDLECTLNILRTQNQELTEQAVADIAIREKLLHENAELREGLTLADKFKSDVLSRCNESDLYFDSLNPLVEWFNDNRQTLAKYEKGEG